MKDMFFPNPANSVIPEDEDTAKARKYLVVCKSLQWAYVLGKTIIYNDGSMFWFQLINVWMLYLAHSTMHYFQSLVCAVLFTLEVIGLSGILSTSDEQKK